MKNVLLFFIGAPVLTTLAEKPAACVTCVGTEPATGKTFIHDPICSTVNVEQEEAELLCQNKNQQEGLIHHSSHVLKQ